MRDALGLREKIRKSNNGYLLKFLQLQEVTVARHDEVYFGLKRTSALIRQRILFLPSSLEKLAQRDDILRLWRAQYQD